MEQLPNRVSDAGPDVPAEPKHEKPSAAAVDRLKRLGSVFPPPTRYAFVRVGDGKRKRER